MNYEISHESGISDFFFTRQIRGGLATPHVHSHLEFDYVLEGEMTLTIDGKTYLLTENTMAVIMPYQIHSHERLENSEMFMMAFPPEYIAEYRQLLSEKSFFPCLISFKQTIRNMICEIAGLETQDYFKNKALMYYTISEFLRCCELRQKDPFEFDVYRSAIVYISEHYTEEISLEHVAAYAKVTASHLSRVLNSHSGSSFSDIVNSLRIFRAKRMIEQTNKTISEIAFATGYGSIRNFNRIFQKYFGCKPTELRSKTNVLHKEKMRQRQEDCIVAEPT